MKTASDLTVEALKADPGFRLAFLKDAIIEIEQGGTELAVVMLRLVAQSLAILILLATPALAFPAIVLGCHDGDTCQVPI